jgi:hypothetical protein
MKCQTYQPIPHFGNTICQRLSRRLVDDPR